MPPRILDRIRAAATEGTYDLTRHAADELAEDDLLIADLEHVMLTGRISRIEHGDARGTRHTISGWTEDRGTEVGIVGRFTETGVFLVITAYEITEKPDDT